MRVSKTKQHRWEPPQTNVYNYATASSSQIESSNVSPIHLADILVRAHHTAVQSGVNGIVRRLSQHTIAGGKRYEPDAPSEVPDDVVGFRVE